MKEHAFLGDEIYRSRLFALFIDLGTKLQVLADRELCTQNITTRQWFLCLVLEQSGGTLSLGELAAKMGTSHQNAKQLALKLEKHGFLTIAQGKADKRSLFLSLTDACKNFWQSREHVDREMLEQLFRGIPDLKVIYDSLSNFHSRIHDLLGVNQDPFFIVKKEFK